MSQIFDENDHVIPVTVIEAGPCVVVQKKTSEKEGYEASSWALRTSLSASSPSREGPPGQGRRGSQEVPAGVRPGECRRADVGDIVKADAFQAGDFVDVTGISKGHGYQGVIKRHGAHRLKETHGSGPVARQIGSLGATSHMSKIIKGTIGAGHMGVEQVTVQNLSVVKVDPELNMLVVCGAIPGPKGGLVTIKSTVKVHKVKQAGADISKNPQKASGRNPQKASARNK
ncbi:MAG: 50S ribosomal protein L3 [Dysosmobacter welbionis]